MVGAAGCVVDRAVDFRIHWHLVVDGFKGVEEGDKKDVWEKDKTVRCQRRA